MIKNSPESPMPEPYRSYVEQRAQTIAHTLEPVVGDENLQLCPRAITSDERVFDDGLVYGCIVERPGDGYKSTLYTGSEIGAHVKSIEQANLYARQVFEAGNRIRLKHPEESNGHGQYTVVDLKELSDKLEAYEHFDANGAVLMPHLAHIDDRFSVGRVDLGTHGHYEYVGREHMGMLGEEETFMGGDIVVTRRGSESHLIRASERLAIPPIVHRLARQSLDAYAAQVDYAGRYSVDIISGSTDNGQQLTVVTDVTPRVGGHTPAESVAIAALHDTGEAFAVAAGRLYYNPERNLTPKGQRFIDTPSLIMSAEVQEVGGAL